jgi:membrane fusion protein, heavy metal efflux system
MDLYEPDSHSFQLDKKLSPARLTRRSQGAILAATVGLAAIIFVVGPAGFRDLISAPPVQQVVEPARVNNPQAFRLTDRQWAALKIQPVAEHIFQDAAETDGRIATDDDLATPVFSPFSGRVTRLIAHAGDTVKKGDPLFGIQAAELAQAQNDLITAAAGLRTAKAQLNLATTNEKRQHELYLAQGAALKDWQ